MASICLVALAVITADRWGSSRFSIALVVTENFEDSTSEYIVPIRVHSQSTGSAAVLQSTSSAGETVEFGHTIGTGADAAAGNADESAKPYSLASAWNWENSLNYASLLCSSRGQKSDCFEAIKNVVQPGVN